MKQTILKTALFSAFAMVITGAAAVGAGEYLGEYCWRADASDGSTREMKVGVSDMGGGHYLFSGTWGKPGSPHPLHGNAEVIDGSVRFIMSWGLTTNTHLLYRHGFMTLDGMLNGMVGAITTKVEKSTGLASIGRFKMPITFVSCE